MKSRCGDAEVPTNVSKNAVTQGACFVDVTRAQRKTQTLSSGIRTMHRHMAPPHTSVIPEVMILVVIIDAKRNLCFLW